MELKNIRLSISALVGAIVASCALLSMTSPAAAKPDIVVTLLQGYCAGPFDGVSTVSVRLAGPGFGAWYPDIKYHFNNITNSITKPQPITNPAVFAIPAGTYNVVVNTISDAGNGPFHTVVVPDCVAHSSFEIKKTVINSTNIPTSSFVFPVDVTCNDGFSTTLYLDNANGFQKTIADRAVDTICHAQENATSPAPNCHWNTTYPNGQSIKVTKFMSRVGIKIQNELICPPPCPEGTIEQTFPGTNDKYCCNHSMDPRSDGFCCKREPPPSAPNEGQVITPGGNALNK